MGRLYNATWGRAFAAFYDLGLRQVEENGLRDMRRELLAGARGRTVDVGAGTGANVGLFSAEVTNLVLAEPGEHMAKRLRRRLREEGSDATVVESPAEALPFEDGTVDTVVFTLVLCTVPDQAAALGEARRVLAPGGRALFIEHVRSEDPRLARWQDRLHRPWRLFADGCNCNRDTVAAIEAAGLEIERLERGELPKAMPPVRPMVRGSALAPAVA
jgi:ubiquinone/menaquinone biosynthesis C-methylase UbiE